ncbi:DegV family protein [Aerococcaceae bacterium DSM 111022]|nr:DegV family protein [Aerococcaceae bacterium DSM 111022]
MKQAIIVDSTAYLSDELANLPNIYQVNLQVLFEDGTTRSDSNQLDDLRDYIELMKKYESFPQTSQPLVGEYDALYQKLIQEGYEIVYCIHLSSGISGTYQTALMLKEQYADQIKSYVIDSKGASIVEEILTRHCLKLIEENVAPELIEKKLQQCADDGRIYLMVETTENLVKSGRLSRSLAMIGNMLKVIPLLYFNEEGKIVLFEKIRTKKRVHQRWIKLIQEGFEKYPDGFVIGFAHADDLEGIEDFIELVKKDVPEYQNGFHISILGPVVASHTAQKSKGICLMPTV